MPFLKPFGTLDVESTAKVMMEGGKKGTEARRIMSPSTDGTAVVLDGRPDFLPLTDFTLVA